MTVPTEKQIEGLGPYLIALFIDAGFIDLWPFEWTRKGMQARREVLANA